MLLPDPEGPVMATISPARIDIQVNALEGFHFYLAGIIDLSQSFQVDHLAVLYSKIMLL